MKKKKTPKQSETIMTEIVYPNDTNPMGILQGGRMVHWMDTAAAICAQNHAENICVTASIDSVKFKAPARVGNIVTIKAKVTRSFHSSMEILVEAWSKEVITQEVQLINEAYFTFVAINSLAKPTNVPVLVPGNQLEKEQFEFAEIRKKHRITQK
jgi:acyl-CoA hydrolase